MTEYINGNMAGFWIAIGFILLALEAIIFGFSTVVFLFAGIGALATGLLLTAGLFPETWIASIACFGVVTGLSSIALWKPFKRLQNKEAAPPQKNNDFEGIEFNLETDVKPTKAGQARFSGIDWRVESVDATPLKKGDRVVIVAANVGVLSVKKTG